MEPRPDFHPIYVSGQYLTSEHLNETHNFLWQEEKATRYVLDGNGIVQGMHPDFTGNNVLQKVSLTTGGAATIDGYILQTNKNLEFDNGVAVTLTWFKTADNVEQIMEKTEFDKIKANLSLSGAPVDLSAIEVILKDTPVEELPVGFKKLEEFGITINQALTNYILLAWIFIKDAENNHCQQGDCNSKGRQRNYINRYFLIQNNLIPPQNFVSPEMPTCSVFRIKNLSTVGSVGGFNQRSFTAWSSSAAELLPYFSNNVSGKQLNIIAALLSTAEQTLLGTTITKFTQINASVNAATCPQYYTTFASDLAKAINELVVFYNDYAKKYPTYNAKRIERTIIIGSFRQTGIDNWRYYFIPAPEQVQYIFDKKKLKALLLRVFAMVNKFIVATAIEEKSKTVNARPLAIPSLNASDVLLQNCAIPYYYNTMDQGIDNEVLKYWNPQGGSLRNIFCYYDANIASRADLAAKFQSADWYNSNFFRIEGHIGMAKAAAVSAVNNLIVNQGLPIQLIDCDVNYKGPKKWHDWYNEFMGNLDEWMVNLRKNYKEYDYAPLKNIQTKMNQTSYRNVSEVGKMANDFYAYSSLFYNTTPPPPPPSGQQAKKIIPGTAYVQFKSVVPKNKMVSIYDKYKDALLEQADLQSQKLVTLKDLVELEYMGGAPRGGTFVLLHNGTNIIGDGCLPYYYRINQARVYSAS